MTEITFGNYRLSVNVEDTRAWYAAYGETAGGCDCAYCRNFAAAADGIPREAGTFLARLGLDIQKPGEVMEQGREADGRHRYTVQYHVAGTLEEMGETDMELAPGITAWFTVDMGPFLRDFPEPFFQCCLDLRLPWALEEPDD